MREEKRKNERKREEKVTEATLSEQKTSHTRRTCEINDSIDLMARSIYTQLIYLR